MGWGLKSCKDIILKEISSLAMGEFIAGIGLRGAKTGGRRRFAAKSGGAMVVG
jgi:hypothetical protein